MTMLRTVVAPIVLVLTGIAGFLALKASKAAPARQERKSPPPLVETAAVEVAPSTFEIEVHGTVVPKREVNLAAEVAGAIVERSDRCDEGRFVDQGTVLLRIDPRRYELEIQRLAGELRQAEVELVKLDVEKSNNDSLIEIAESELSIANDELQRIDRLAQRQAASPSQLDQAKSAAMKARNNLQTIRNAQKILEAQRDHLNAQLELSKVRLDLARLDLEKTTIAAPIDGIVVAVDVEQDSFVQPGTPLLQIQDLSAVEVMCHLRVEDLYWLRQSQLPPTELPPAGEVQSLFESPRADAIVTYRIGERQYRWEGFLSRYAGIGLDERTRTVPCLVEVPDPARSLTPGAPKGLVRGMFVSVALKAHPSTHLVQAPIEALRPGHEVWTVRGGELAVHRVAVARMYENKVLIQGERPAPGDRVVVSPLAVATDGMKVREARD